MCRATRRVMSSMCFAGRRVWHLAATCCSAAASAEPISLAATRALFDGIRRKLFTLPSDTVVYPGHGPVTTVAHEMRTNPFVAMGA